MVEPQPGFEPGISALPVRRFNQTVATEALIKILIQDLLNNINNFNYDPKNKKTYKKIDN